MLKNYVYKVVLIFLFYALPAVVHAQDSVAVKTGSGHKQHKITKRSLGLYMDDDFFQLAGKGTDQYYTGGWQADIYYTRNAPPAFLDRILLRLDHSSEDLYCYGFFRRLYTPTDISKSEILYGDRPYAGVVTMQHKLTCTNVSAKEQLSSEWGIGIMGPAAMGKQYQTFAHELIGSKKPMGWGNQVHNSPVLDYKIAYEKQVLKPSENIKIVAVADAEAGTLVDNVGVGFALRAGIFNDEQLNYMLPLPGSKRKKIRLYGYMKPVIRVVMYNATLEGGFFSNSDPYVINTGDINNVYLQYDEGLVFTTNKFGIELIQKLRTPEFKTGKSQQVGNITVFIFL